MVVSWYVQSTLSKLVKSPSISILKVAHLTESSVLVLFSLARKSYITIRNVLLVLVLREPDKRGLLFLY